MMKNFLNLFRPYKKGYGVAYYLDKLDKNKNLNFQMDFLRSGKYMDLQIYRFKSMVRDEIPDNHSFGPNDYVLSMLFSMGNEYYKECFQRFRDSEMFDNSQLVYENNTKSIRKYNLYIKENNKDLFSGIKFIIEKIYKYDKNTSYQLAFHKLPN